MQDNYKGEERRNIDPIILDKLMNLTEQYLNSTNAVSQKLSENIVIGERLLGVVDELKSRGNINDRDHADVKDKLTQVATNTFDIINKMNKASNEKIIDMLEDNEDFNTKMQYKFNETAQYVKSLNDKFSYMSSLDSNVKNIGKGLLDIKEDIIKELNKTTTSFLVIQRILGAISVLIAGVIVASSVWKFVQDQSLSKDIQIMIQEEIRTNLK